MSGVVARLLIVDDESAQMRALCDTLVLEGYATHGFSSARQALSELRPGQFVLVRFGPGSKGMMAAEIQPETGSPGLSSH